MKNIFSLKHWRGDAYCQFPVPEHNQLWVCFLVWSKFSTVFLKLQFIAATPTLVNIHWWSKYTQLRISSPLIKIKKNLFMTLSWWTSPMTNWLGNWGQWVGVASASSVILSVLNEGASLRGLLAVVGWNLSSALFGEKPWCAANAEDEINPLICTDLQRVTKEILLLQTRLVCHINQAHGLSPRRERPL